MDVLHGDVGDGQLGRKLIAGSEILLAVALGNLDGIVDVTDLHRVVGDVVDTALATTALKVAGKGSGRTGPDFDAGTVAGVGHRDVVYEDVLDDISLGGVLTQGANRDTVAPVALQILDEDVGAVGLERDTVVTIVDHRVLYNNVVTAVSVPTILEK